MQIKIAASLRKSPSMECLDFLVAAGDRVTGRFAGRRWRRCPQVPEDSRAGRRERIIQHRAAGGDQAGRGAAGKHALGAGMRADDARIHRGVHRSGCGSPARRRWRPAAQTAARPSTTGRADRDCRRQALAARKPCARIPRRVTPSFPVPGAHSTRVRWPRILIGRGFLIQINGPGPRIRNMESRFSSNGPARRAPAPEHGRDHVDR